MSLQPDYPSQDEAEFSEAQVIEPIHVVVDKQEEVQQTPEFGSWQSISWPAASSQISTAQQLLPQARSRSEAQIIVVNGTGAGAGAFVRVGTWAQVTGNGGAQLQAGRYPYHAAQPVFVASDGVNAMIVNFLDERYLV